MLDNQMIPDMRTWLLTWNPTIPKSWDDFDRNYRRARSGRAAGNDWSVHNNRSIAPGDRLFILRQGLEPKGIVASALATGSPSPGPHWSGESGKLTNYVPLAFDAILNPDVEAIIPLAKLTARRPLAGGYWETQRSGVEIPQAAAVELERLWLQHLDTLKRGIVPVPVKKSRTEDNYPDSAFEGAARTAFVTHKKRERWLRASKVRDVLARTGRLACEVQGCGFDFEAVYGELGEEYAHIHHKKPLRDKIKPERTRLDDLAVVCANCHAMVHRGGKCRNLEEVSPQRTQARGRG